MKCRSFSDAKKFVYLLKLKSSKDWAKYCESGYKPRDIPYSPYRAYKNLWRGWSDWLGTVTPRDIEYMSFEEARKFVHSLGLKNREEWNEYCKSGKKPAHIPSYPNQTYKKDWNGMGDWLGTGAVSNIEKHKQMLPYNEAKKFVHSLGLKNAREWEEYRKSKNKD